METEFEFKITRQQLMAWRSTRVIMPAKKHKRMMWLWAFALSVAVFNGTFNLIADQPHWLWFNGSLALFDLWFLISNYRSYRIAKIREAMDLPEILLWAFRYHWVSEWDARKARRRDWWGTVLDQVGQNLRLGR